MFRKTRVLASVLAAILLALLSTATGCGGTGALPLKLQLKAGQSFTYDIAMATTGSTKGPSVSVLDGLIPVGSSVKALMTMSVKEVKDGISTIECTYENVEATLQGKTETLSTESMPAVTMKINERGQVVSVQSGGRGLPVGFGGGLDLSSFADQTGPVFPDSGSAKPGDEWTATSAYPVPGMAQDVSATTTAKLLSVSEEGGRTLAKVEYSVDAPFDVDLDVAAMIAEMGLGATLPSDVNLDTLAFKMAMEGAESMKGTTQIDADTGLPALFDSDILLNLTIYVQEAPANLVPENQRGPFTIDLAVNVKLTRVGSKGRT